MVPSIELSGLRHSHWYQFAVRFVLGGAVTVCTGLVERHWGPVAGGLFLSFPAILPATATLIERQQTERLRRAGREGSRRGRRAAALDASGAALGGYALACFGVCAWRLLPAHSPAWVLPLSALVWLVVAVLAWCLRRRL